MKGIDVTVVRFAPFFLFVLFVSGIIYSCVHGETPTFYYLHSNSAVYALSLFLISLSNKKYHCVYNRAMYLFLIIVPIINYLEIKFNVFPCTKAYCVTIILLSILTIVITSYLAIQHFILKSKLKLDNGRN